LCIILIQNKVRNPLSNTHYFRNVFYSESTVWKLEQYIEHIDGKNMHMPFLHSQHLRSTQKMRGTSDKEWRKCLWIRMRKKVREIKLKLCSLSFIHFLLSSVLFSYWWNSTESNNIINTIISQMFICLNRHSMRWVLCCKSSLISLHKYRINF